MNIGQKTLPLDGLNWHCLSIFYARSNIGALLEIIGDFCKKNESLFEHWSLWFSRAQGERVNLVFVSLENDAEMVVGLIGNYFEWWLNENPSEEVERPVPGTILWKFFPNNTLTWNTFKIPRFLRESQNTRDFARTTSRMIVNLWDEGATYSENITSIATFMVVQLQKASGEPFPKIDDIETAETLQSYWTYEGDELLREWLQHPNIDQSVIALILGCRMSQIVKLIMPERT